MEIDEKITCPECGQSPARSEWEREPAAPVTAENPFPKAGKSTGRRLHSCAAGHRWAVVAPVR